MTRMTLVEKALLYKQLRLRKFKPGETAPMSGQYTNSDGDQVTMVKGRRFPPEPRKNMRWRITDYTR